jgi:glucose-1-phosphate cytidylyltransferase
MKVGILAGGLGSRLSEETTIKPKPMVEIGDAPILWHIMKYYASFGHTEFAVGPRLQGRVHQALVGRPSDARWRSGREHRGRHRPVQRRPRRSRIGPSTSSRPDAHTNTGGRIKRLVPYLGSDGTFMVTWGDGVATVDLDALVEFHRSHGKLCTLTAVHPPARYGHLEIDGDQITEFSEKPQAAEGWINGAFFVMEPEIADYIDGDDTLFEREPLERLAAEGQLMAYKHTDFWACMDTVRDKVMLEGCGSRATPRGRCGTEEAGARHRSRRLHRHRARPDAAASRARGRRHRQRCCSSRACSARTVSRPDIELRLDVRDVEPDHFDGVDAVIHLAGMSNDPAGDLNPAATYEINHRASSRLAEIAKDAGVSASCSRRRAPPTAPTATTSSTSRPSSCRSRRTASRRSSSSRTSTRSPTTRSRRRTCATRPRTACPNGCAATSWSTT